MAVVDMPVAALRSYRPQVETPPDLMSFWSETLAEAYAIPVEPVFEPVESGIRTLDTYDVTFSGFGGHRVRGWLRVPAVRSGPLPCVVQYIGYGGGRGLAHENLLWAAAGYAHFVMDTRGQGSGYTVGDTGDPVFSGPAHPGFMTRGILDPTTYYYRRLYTDAVRAVDAVRAHEAVATTVAVTGGSQGGGLALAVVALRDDVAAAMPDVPFLCDFPRGVEVADAGPYQEIARYLKVHRNHVQQAFRTLAYFDNAILASLATAPALFSVALQDTICPPSTVYAAFNAYAGDKAIVAYPFNDHEGGEGFHQAEQLRWLADRREAF
jgi:cephalosporin-C deacetylase